MSGNPGSKKLDLRVRAAEVADASSIARIYNHYIENSTCTFHTQPVDDSERAEWISCSDPSYPRLVALSGDRVVGWGSLVPWASRPAWYPSVELAVYVSHELLGQGIGRLLMESLIARAREVGHHAVLGQIVAENESSISLARSIGFEEVGRLREVGEKFGRRLDVVIMEIILR